MANGTIAFDTLSTSGQIDGTARSIDTDYLLMGSAKAWVQGSSDTTFRDKFNVGSGTDNGTGDYTYTFTNNMANNDYAAHHTATDANTNTAVLVGVTKGSTFATGSLGLYVLNEDTGVSDGSDPSSISVLGDLARLR